MTLLSPPRTDDIVDVIPEAEPVADITHADDDRPAGPAEHEIATEAYTRYLLRGCRDGHAVEDWLGAERSLRERYASPPSRA